MFRRYPKIESMYEKSQNHKSSDDFYKFCSTIKIINNKLFHYLHDFLPRLWLKSVQNFYCPLKNTLYNMIQNHDYIKALINIFY